MAVYRRPEHINIVARGPHAEDYDSLIHQLQPPAQARQGSGDLVPARGQNPTPTSSVVGVSEANGFHKRSPYLGSENSISAFTPSQSPTMDRRFSQPGMQMRMNQDIQDDESAFIVQQGNASHGMQSIGMFASTTDHEQTLLQQPAFDFMWADIDNTSSMDTTHSNTMGNFLTSDGSFLDSQLQFHGLGFDMSSAAASNLVMASSSSQTPYTNELKAMDTFADLVQSTNADAFVRNNDALLEHPMVHRAGGSSNHVSQLNAQAERMMPSPPEQSATVSRKSSSQAASDGVPPLFGRLSPDPSRSPSISPTSQEPAADQAWRQQGLDSESRRPSMTTDLASNFDHVNIQGHQSAEDLVELHQSMHVLQQGLFKKPSLPNSNCRETLAERRKQSLPKDIKVQRPTNMTLGRAASSGAIHQTIGSNRYPPSPLNTLKRHKSSNPVINGRIVKSGTSSARNSPMVGSFSDAAGQTSSQITPQPPLNTAIPTTQSLAPPPSPHPHGQDLLSEALPSSASTTMYTPGIYSGSLPSNSFQSTPVTTPYGFNIRQQQQQAYNPQQNQPKGSHWPPASDIPQSAPAHMLSFPRDMSPTHNIGSMPATPHNYQFESFQQMPTFGAPMAPQHHIPVVPSQHGVPEQMTFMHPGLINAPPQSFYGHPHDLDDPYAVHGRWMHDFVPQIRREMDFKLDQGCEKLRQEVSAGRATLVPMDPRGEYTFQNLTSNEMKRQLDKE